MRLSRSQLRSQLQYTSMTTPPSLLEYDVPTGTFALLKQKPVCAVGWAGVGQMPPDGDRLAP